MILFKRQEDSDMQRLINEFENIKLTDIPEFDMPKTKVRELNPIACGSRIK